MELTLTHEGAGSRFKSMLAVDARRMFRTRLFYLMLLISTAIPILVLVMTTMNTDPAQGSAMFTSVWQAIGSTDGSMGMDITSMCNINMIYFLAAVLVCCFVSADFKSGYARNLFAIRPGRGDYAASKTVICLIAGVLLLAGYTVGALVGGAIAGLPFSMEGFTAANLALCLVSKAFLMAVFVGIYLLMSVIGRGRLWMGLILSFFVGMFLFMIIPMMTPLTSTMMNVILCLAGGAIFAAVFGIASRTVLRRSDLV